MADNKPWYKLYLFSATSDEFINLGMANFGRYVWLSTYVNYHGEDGSMTLTPPAKLLCTAMEFDSFDHMIDTFKTFPSVSILNTPNPNSGPDIAKITFLNHKKEQGDFSTPRVTEWRKKTNKNKQLEVMKRNVTEMKRVEVDIEVDKDKELEKEKKKNIQSVFDFWNKQKIVVHRELTKFKSHINARLDAKYKVCDLLEAICNYSLILESDEFYFSYRWGLDHFLNPDNLDRFLTINNPFMNFRNDKGNGRKETLG